MDRFVTRQPRANADYPPGNQFVAFTANAASSSMVQPEKMYFPGNYPTEYPNIQRMITSSYIPVNHVINNTPTAYQQFNPDPGQAQGQTMSGIDPRYFLGYTDNSMQYILTGQQMQRIPSNVQACPGNVQGIPGNVQASSSNLQGIPGNIQASPSNVQDIPGNVQVSPRNMQGIPGNVQTSLRNVQGIPGNVQASPRNVQGIPGNVQASPRKVQIIPGNAQASPSLGANYQNDDVTGPYRNNLRTFTSKVIHAARKQQETPKPVEAYVSIAPNGSVTQDLQSKSTGSNSNIKRKDNVDLAKNEVKNQILTRADKLKALYKTGPRVFSGPVENVLKWHKSLQDIGILIIYEVVAKCLSITPGVSGTKNLVVRGEHGPAMQVVYPEIDFLLPDLNPPCTVRVIGRMLAGSSRLQAFKVRLATGDDVTMQSRRAAIAEHHVAKLCKQYGNNP